MTNEMTIQQQQQQQVNIQWNTIVLEMVDYVYSGKPLEKIRKPRQRELMDHTSDTNRNEMKMEYRRKKCGKQKENLMAATAYSLSTCN